MSFRAVLTAGKKAPYRTWTFLVVPLDVATRWGSGPKAVRGTIAGHAFRGTASRGEGVMRVPISRDFRVATGLRCGDAVDVEMELDAEPRQVSVPGELRAVLERDSALAALFEQLPPAHRRAWAAYVGDAKRPETRLRRAMRAPAGIRARAFPG